MELCTGGDLFERISNEKQFNELKAFKTMTSILSALFYCHANGIMHRDLKPENIIYVSQDDNANLKIIDFGTSKIFNK